MIGRQRELALIAGLLRDGPRALVIEGEEGAGKSALWRAALTQDCRVLACRARLADLVAAAGEVVATLPAPQRDVLRALAAAGRDEPRGPAAPDETRAATGRDEPRGPAAPGTARAAAGPGEPRAVAVALRALLEAAAPVLVAIDDADRLDEDSARVLGFALRRVAGQAVGILLTQRPGADALGLERALGHRRLARVRLGPLELAELRELLEGRRGEVPARPLLRRLAEASGGNPLVALELARGGRAAPGEPLAVTPRLRALVAERLASVPARAREALLVTAALAEPTVDVVERAASAAGLLAAEDAGLLTTEGGRVAMSRPLDGLVLYAAATRERRRALHAALAAIVTAPEERARHAALAGEGTAEALEAAATHARDHATAAELLELASAATPAGARRAARAAGAAMAAGAARQAASAGRAATTGGATRRAAGAGRAAMAASAATPDAAATRRAVRAAEHHLRAGDPRRARELLAPVGHDPEALRVLAAANEDRQERIALLERARSLATSAAIEIDLAHATKELKYAERALQLAERPDQVGEALATIALLGGPNEIDVALRQPENPLTPPHRRPRAIAAALKLDAGRLEEARAELTALDTKDCATLLCRLAWLELLAGDLDAATDRVREAELAATEVDGPLVQAHKAQLHARRGDFDAARAAAAQAPGEPLAATALALVALGEGDHAAQTDEPPNTASPFDRACNLLAQARARRAANDHRGERAALDEAERLFEAIGAHGWAERTRALTRPRLTPAEQRVAELAAAGRRNKEIARALEVTVHTVEVHLSNAYAKLGIRSRTQLAARLSPAGTSPR